MKKEKHESINGIKSLGMESLHKHIVGSSIEGNRLLTNDLINIIGAHRALPDVEAMVRVFTHQSLVRCLSHIPVRSPKKQVKLWMEQRHLYQRTSSLITSLGGKPAVTAAQAKRLDSLGFSHASLVELRSVCEDDPTFCQSLRKRGVRSKPLQQKLVKCLHAPSK